MLTIKRSGRQAETKLKENEQNALFVYEYTKVT